MTLSIKCKNSRKTSLLRKALALFYNQCDSKHVNFKSYVVNTVQATRPHSRKAGSVIDELSTQPVNRIF